MPYATFAMLLIPAFEVCPVHVVPLLLVETFFMLVLPPLEPTATHNPLPYATPEALSKAFGVLICGLALVGPVLQKILL